LLPNEALPQLAAIDHISNDSLKQIKIGGNSFLKINFSLKKRLKSFLVKYEYKSSQILW
jgi:hypothetical protein